MVTSLAPAPLLGRRITRSYRLLRVAIIAAVCAALIAGAIVLQFSFFAPGDDRRSDVRLLADNSVQPDAFSVIARRGNGIDVFYSTYGLPVGHIVTLKALIFNRPQDCAHGVDGRRCGEADIQGADGSVVFVQGLFYRQSTSKVEITSQITANDRSHVVTGNGLTNPWDAAIYLVVADHGPPIPSLFGEMLSTLGAGCKDAPPGSGPPGSNDCVDLQLSSHE